MEEQQPLAGPVLLFDDGEEDGEPISDRSDARYVYSIPERRGLLAKGFDRLAKDVNWVTPQGWVLALDPAGGAFLRDPLSSNSRTIIRLPPDPDNLLANSSSEDTRCLLSTRRATDPDCVVLLIHLEEPTFCYCRPGGTRWYRHQYRPELLGDGDRERVVRELSRRLTSVAGRFYACHSAAGNLTALEFSPAGPPTLTSIRVARSTPIPTGCSLEYHLVESRGELFMLQFRFSWFLLYDMVVHIQVLKMDTSKNVWIKVGRLGDNTVFFVRRSQGVHFGVSMAADDLGLEPNCIYFTQELDKGLLVYNMDQGTTRIHNPGRDVPDLMEPILLMPVCTVAT